MDFGVIIDSPTSVLTCYISLGTLLALPEFPKAIERIKQDSTWYVVYNVY